MTHAAPSTETMKRTRMDVGVRSRRELYQSTNQASIPSVGTRVTNWKMRQKMKDKPAKDMMAVGAGKAASTQEIVMCSGRAVDG